MLPRGLHSEEGDDVKENGSNSMERRGFIAGILAVIAAPLALVCPRPSEPTMLRLTTITSGRRKAVWLCESENKWRLIPAEKVRPGDRLLLPPPDGRQGVLAPRKVLYVRHGGSDTFVAMTAWDRHNEEYWPKSVMQEMGFGDGGAP
jgi:hypothetical protein